MAISRYKRNSFSILELAMTFSQNKYRYDSFYPVLVLFIFFVLQTSCMAVRIFITEDTFDKKYNELTGRIIL